MIEGGVKGFYRGIAPSLARGILVNGIMLGLYEEMRRGAKGRLL